MCRIKPHKKQKKQPEGKRSKRKEVLEVTSTDSLVPSRVRRKFNFFENSTRKLASDGRKKKKTRTKTKKKQKDNADEPESDEEDWNEYYAIEELVCELRKNRRTYFLTSFVDHGPEFNTIWPEKKVRWHARQSKTEHVFDNWLLTQEKGLPLLKENLVMEKESLKLPGALVIGKGGKPIATLKGKKLWPMGTVPKRKVAKSKGPKKRAPVKQKAVARGLPSANLKPLVHTGTGVLVGELELEGLHLNHGPQGGANISAVILSPKLESGLEQAGAEAILEAKAEESKSNLKPAEMGSSALQPEAPGLQTLANSATGNSRLPHSNTAAKVKRKRPSRRKGGKRSKVKPENGALKQIRVKNLEAKEAAFNMLHAFHASGSAFGRYPGKGKTTRKDIIKEIARRALVDTDQVESTNFLEFTHECTRKSQNVRGFFGKVVDEIESGIRESDPEMYRDTEPKDLVLKMLDASGRWLTPQIVSDAFVFLRVQPISIRQIQLILLQVAARVTWRPTPMRPTELTKSARATLVAALNKVDLVTEAVLMGNQVSSNDVRADGLVAVLLGARSEEIVKKITKRLSDWRELGVQVEAGIPQAKPAGVKSEKQSASGVSMSESEGALASGNFKVKSESSAGKSSPATPSGSPVLRLATGNFKVKSESSAGRSSQAKHSESPARTRVNTAEPATGSGIQADCEFATPRKVISAHADLLVVLTRTS